MILNLYALRNTILQSYLKEHGKRFHEYSPWHNLLTMNNCLHGRVHEREEGLLAHLKHNCWSIWICTFVSSSHPF